MTRPSLPSNDTNILQTSQSQHHPPLFKYVMDHPLSTHSLSASSYPPISPDPSHPSRYQLIQQQAQQEERHKAHQLQQQKEQLFHKQEEKRIRRQIREKKIELEKLSRAGLNSQNAHQQAQLKKEQNSLRQLQTHIQQQEAKDRARKRGIKAVQRQATLDTYTHYKHTQAKATRNIHCWTAHQERRKARQVHKSQVVLSKTKQEEKKKTYKQTILDYKASLGNHYAGSSTKGKELGQKPLVVRENEEDSLGDRAKVKGKVQQAVKIKQSQRNEEQQRRRREVAEARGEAALAKVRQEKGYEEYCRGAQQEQLRFNREKLQYGVANQRAGVKPQTLFQIQKNQQIHAEKEFENLFFSKKGKKKGGNLANHHQIVEEQMKEPLLVPSPPTVLPNKPINYEDEDSLVPGQSDAHYSFEESRSCSRYRQELPRPILKQEMEASMGKTQMRQTRVDGGERGVPPQLNYSQDSDI